MGCSRCSGVVPSCCRKKVWRGMALGNERDRSAGSDYKASREWRRHPGGIQFAVARASDSTIDILGDITISDFTELAIRLYFRAAWSARRVLASTASLLSSPRATRMTGLKCNRVKISVRSSSTSLVPSARHSNDSSFRRKRSVAHRNIIMTQLFAAATKASSGVRTPGCPCASGGAENLISGPLPI